MPNTEFYHTLQRYQVGGMQPFLEHIRDYLTGERTIPVCKVTAVAGNDITLTFSNDLLKIFLDDFLRIEKPYEVALKYGFRGYSRGEQNGIFYQYKDKKMRKKVGRLVQTHEAQILEDLDIAREGLDALRRVKIVWHEPSGVRVVGVYAPDKARVCFMDFASY